jgi:hypothetical protein
MPGPQELAFAGADCGGERAAAMYSLLETAKLNGVNPQEWLANVLDRVGDIPSTGSMNCCRGTGQRTNHENFLARKRNWVLKISCCHERIG